MKALLYKSVQNIKWCDVDKCKIEDYILPFNLEPILIKTQAVGICGSDIHAWQGHDNRRPAPLILGHEAVGVALNGKYKNQTVVVNPLLVCGECFHCKNNMDNLCSKRQIISMPPLQGAFAEYFITAEQNLILVPKGFDSKKAALIEPIACAFHSVKKSLELLPETMRQAVVIGAGGIGYACAICLEMFGFNDISIAETNSLRRSNIKKLARFDVFDPETKDKNNLPQCHLVIDAHGSDATRKLALEMLKPAGVLTHIGLAGGTKGLDIRKMTLQEMKFIGIYTYTKQDFNETANAVFSGAIGKVDWCDYLPMKDGAKAFDDIKNGSVAAAKIILNI